MILMLPAPLWIEQEIFSCLIKNDLWQVYCLRGYRDVSKRERKRYNKKFYIKMEQIKKLFEIFSFIRRVFIF